MYLFKGNWNTGSRKRPESNTVFSSDYKVFGAFSGAIAGIITGDMGFAVSSGGKTILKH